MQVEENEIVKFWIDDGILFSSVPKPIDIGLEEAKLIIETRHKISNNTKQYWCFSLTNLKSYSKEGRDYADIHGQDLLYASAVVVNNHVHMFLYNIFVKIKNPKIPFQAFNKEEKALLWLNEIKHHLNSKA